MVGKSVLCIWFAKNGRIGDTWRMMITIADVLGPAEVEAARLALAERPGTNPDMAGPAAKNRLFIDGGATAGAGARRVKFNLQGRSDAPPIRAVAEKVRRALLANEIFSTAALPVSFARVMVSLYEPGMSYGWHTDEAFIDNRRTDLSFTLFLSDPGSYSGGALEITNTAGVDAIRLPAGGLVLYSSGDLHRVTEVTAGQRLAVVGWVQSRIRSREQRELQFKLAAARAEIQALAPDTALALAGMRQELLRMWSDPPGALSAELRE